MRYFFLVSFFILVIFPSKAQIAYKLDSTIQYWPDKTIKSIVKTYKCEGYDTYYSFTKTFYESGLPEKKSFVCSGNDSNNIIYGYLHWNDINKIETKAYGNNDFQCRFDVFNQQLKAGGNWFNLSPAPHPLSASAIDNFAPQGFRKIPSGFIKNFNTLFPFSDSVFIQSHFLQETEVTNKEYRKFIQSLLRDSAEVLGKDFILEHLMPDNKVVSTIVIQNKKIPLKEYFNNIEYDQFPAAGINWFATKYYCEWYTQQLQLKYPELKNAIQARLPKELEWEYDATEGLGWREYLKKNSTVIGNFNTPNDQWQFTSPVKTFPQNMFGLYDMFGNVQEWCEDAYYSSDNVGRWEGDPLNWALERCYYNENEPLKMLRGGSLNDSLNTAITTTWRKPSNQESKTYLSKRYISTNGADKAASQKTTSQSIRPSDIGFRVLIEVIDPRASYYHFIDGRWEEF